MTKNSAYKDAGVDIDAGTELVERIKPAIKKTLRSGVMSSIGGFGALFDPKAAGYDDPVLVSATDGVGTKLKIAIDTDKHDTVGIDLVAMCVNDLIVQGAEPLFFLDYFACGKLEVEQAQDVISGIAQGCKQAGCALIGGETAEMPGMYKAKDYDLAGFTVGAVNRDDILTGDDVQSGDVILALGASGLHSNGFSLVRRIVETTQGFDYQSSAEFTQGKTLGEFLLTPTKIYVKSILKALKVKEENTNKSAIRGIANITGGGLIENIPRILPDTLSAQIDTSTWTLPPVFQWLGQAGNLSITDMATTLNCGIGMVVIVHPDYATQIQTTLEENGENVFTIGQIINKDNNPSVILDNAQREWNLKA